MKEVVNNHKSLRISAGIPRAWRILLFRSTIIEIDRYGGGLVLNEHGDLYFLLLNNFGVQIIPFKTKIKEKKRKIIGRKTRYS